MKTRVSVTSLESISSFSKEWLGEIFPRIYIRVWETSYKENSKWSANALMTSNESIMNLDEYAETFNKIGLLGSLYGKDLFYFSPAKPEKEMFQLEEFKLSIEKEIKDIERIILDDKSFDEKVIKRENARYRISTAFKYNLFFLCRKYRLLTFLDKKREMYLLSFVIKKFLALGVKKILANDKDFGTFHNIYDYMNIVLYSSNSNLIAKLIKDQWEELVDEEKLEQIPAELRFINYTYYLFYNPASQGNRSEKQKRAEEYLAYSISQILQITIREVKEKGRHVGSILGLEFYIQVALDYLAKRFSRGDWLWIKNYHFPNYLKPNEQHLKNLNNEFTELDLSSFMRSNIYIQLLSSENPNLYFYNSDHFKNDFSLRALEDSFKVLYKTLKGIPAYHYIQLLEETSPKSDLDFYESSNFMQAVQDLKQENLLAFVSAMCAMIEKRLSTRINLFERFTILGQPILLNEIIKVVESQLKEDSQRKGFTIPAIIFISESLTKGKNYYGLNLRNEIAHGVKTRIAPWEAAVVMVAWFATLYLTS